MLPSRPSTTIATTSPPRTPARVRVPVTPVRASAAHTRRRASAAASGRSPPPSSTAVTTTIGAPGDRPMPCACASDSAGPPPGSTPSSRPSITSMVSRRFSVARYCWCSRKAFAAWVLIRSQKRESGVTIDSAASRPTSESPAWRISAFHRAC